MPFMLSNFAIKNDIFNLNENNVTIRNKPI